MGTLPKTNRKTLKYAQAKIVEGVLREVCEQVSQDPNVCKYKGDWDDEAVADYVRQNNDWADFVNVNHVARLRKEVIGNYPRIKKEEKPVQEQLPGFSVAVFEVHIRELERSIQQLCTRLTSVEDRIYKK